MEFSRQTCWSRLPFPSPGNLPDPGIKLVSLEFPELASEFFLSLCHLESPSIKPKYTVSYLSAGAFCHFILTMLKYSGCSKYAS